MSDAGIQEIRIPRDMVPRLVAQLGSVIEPRLVCLGNVGALSALVTLQSAADLIVTDERALTAAPLSLYSACDLSVRLPGSNPT